MSGGPASGSGGGPGAATTGHVHATNRRKALVAIAADAVGFTIVELAGSDATNLGDRMQEEREESGCVVPFNQTGASRSRQSAGAPRPRPSAAAAAAAVRGRFTWRTPARGLPLRAQTNGGGVGMGLPPRGDVVGSVPVVRACGHTQDFLEHRADRFRAQRLAKFRQTRCPECAARLVERQRRAEPPRKGKALGQLPPGTQVTLTRSGDGSWAGTLSAEGLSAEAIEARRAGPADTRRRARAAVGRRQGAEPRIARAGCGWRSVRPTAEYEPLRLRFS